MSTLIATPPKPAVIYPDSDGQPMADNTLQFEWIVTIKGGLEALYSDNLDVFIAGDLLWYPVEGEPTICTAPDVMVVFGRRKGYRGSYMQWLEDNIPPQVVFEVLSPGNRFREMLRKYQFYRQYGVEEYYLYDPDNNELTVYLRSGDELREVPTVSGFASPRMQTRFELKGGTLRIYGPDGRPFATYVELVAQRNQAEQRAERLAAQLRALGVTPEA